MLSSTCNEPVQAVQLHELFQRVSRSAYEFQALLCIASLRQQLTFFCAQNPGRAIVQFELLAMCLDGTHVHNLLIFLSNVYCSGLDLEMT